MTYTELLSQKEWTEKCNHILQRDKYRCRDCGKIGFHNNTFYVTDSLDEVDEILNENVLIGDKFSSLLEQTLKDRIEFDENNPKGYNIYAEMHKKVRVVWIPYKNVKSSSTNKLYNTNIYKLWLYRPWLLPFPTMEGSSSIFITTQKNIETFDFTIYLYPKVRDSRDGPVSYPMAILKFDEELTDKYYLYIDDKSVNLTYKKFAFFVCLSREQFMYDGLNVHHKYYVRGKKPWEYDDDTLVTLCADCHKKRHAEEQIPVYKSLAERVVYGFCDVCDKCGGSGYLPQYSYYEHGICFKCGGEGVIVK